MYIAVLLQGKTSADKGKGSSGVGQLILVMLTEFGKRIIGFTSTPTNQFFNFSLTFYYQ